MIRRLLSLALVAMLLGAFALVSCKQDEGKTCQTTSDCEGDLVCCFDANAASSTLGTCLPQDTCTPLPYASVSEDASP